MFCWSPGWSLCTSFNVCFIWQHLRVAQPTKQLKLQTSTGSKGPYQRDIKTWNKHKNEQWVYIDSTVHACTATGSSNMNNI